MRIRIEMHSLVQLNNQSLNRNVFLLKPRSPTYEQPLN